MGKYTDKKKFISELSKINRFRKVVIHTIGVYTGSVPDWVYIKNPTFKPEDKVELKRFMKDIARENAGQYREVN